MKTRFFLSFILQQNLLFLRLIKNELFKNRYGKLMIFKFYERIRRNYLTKKNWYSLKIKPSSRRILCIFSESDKKIALFVI